MRKITVIVLVLVFLFLSGCTEETTNTDPDTRQGYNIHWYNHTKPYIQVIIINHTKDDSCIILYDFTDVGLRDALDYVEGLDNVMFVFPDGSMNVSGTHKNNSSFYVKGSNFSFIGQGRSEPDPNNSSRFIRTTRDTKFIVNDTEDYSTVFYFDSCNNLFVEGLNVTFMTNSSAFAFYNDNGEYAVFRECMIYQRANSNRRKNNESNI